MLLEPFPPSAEPVHDFCSSEKSEVGDRRQANLSQPRAAYSKSLRKISTSYTICLVQLLHRPRRLAEHAEHESILRCVGAKNLQNDSQDIIPCVCVFVCLCCVGKVRDHTRIGSLGSNCITNCCILLHAKEGNPVDNIVYGRRKLFQAAAREPRLDRGSVCGQQFVVCCIRCIPVWPVLSREVTYAFASTTNNNNTCLFDRTTVRAALHQEKRQLSGG